MSLVAILDTGFEEHSELVEALQLSGAQILVTTNRAEILNADGFIIHSSGDFSSLMKSLEKTHGPELIDKRLAGGKAVLGIGTGLQVMFETHFELDEETSGLSQWPGALKRTANSQVKTPSMEQVLVAKGSKLFDGIESPKFWFGNSHAVSEFTLQVDPPFVTPAISYLAGGTSFVAAVENGPLTGVQFHPEKSGEAGLALLRNWLGTI